MLGPNVKIASEKKMRAEADSLAGVENLRAELVPFTFPLRDRRHTVEIKNVPMCFTLGEDRDHAQPWRCNCLHVTIQVLCNTLIYLECTD